MSTPPPYTNITGISRAVMKDNAQESISGYNGNARPGELVVNLETNPPALFVGNNLGQLTQLGTGGSGDYGNANVVTLLSAFGSNTISTTGNIDAGQVILINGTRIRDTAGNAVSIGVNAGTNSQGNRAVAIGLQAGETSQGVGGIAIGEQAGQISQGVLSVAVGYLAGANAQSFSAVAIGAQAGETAQGSGAIAIGDLAGRTDQASNSIIINATGANLNQTTANTFTVAPIRNDVANTGEVVFYNTTSKEITYGNSISIAGNITAGNVEVTEQNDKFITAFGTLGYNSDRGTWGLESTGGFGSVDLTSATIDNETGNVTARYTVAVINDGRLLIPESSEANVAKLTSPPNNANVSLQLYSGNAVRIVSNSAGEPFVWTFGTTGTFTAPGNISAVSNISGDNINASVSFGLPVYADATARDAAITSPTPGQQIYVADTGMQVRGATQWNTVAGTGT